MVQNIRTLKRVEVKTEDPRGPAGRKPENLRGAFEVRQPGVLLAAFRRIPDCGCVVAKCCVQGLLRSSSCWRPHPTHQTCRPRPHPDREKKGWGKEEALIACLWARRKPLALLKGVAFRSFGPPRRRVRLSLLQLVLHLYVLVSLTEHVVRGAQAHNDNLLLGTHEHSRACGLRPATTLPV